MRYAYPPYPKGLERHHCNSMFKFFPLDGIRRKLGVCAQRSRRHFHHAVAIHRGSIDALPGPFSLSAQIPVKFWSLV